MIDTSAPAPNPRTRKPYNYYRPLIDAVVQARGEYVAFALDVIGGKTIQAKSTRMHDAAHIRGVRIETTHQHGRLYVRLAPAPQARLVVTEVVAEGGAQ